MTENRSSYQCDPGNCLRVRVSHQRPIYHYGQCWHETVLRRLEWQGGPSEGADADLDAWNRLGSRREAAA